MNVYDYYRNRLALEQARREVRPRRFSFRLPAVTTPVYGAAAGFVLALVGVALTLDAAPPAAMLLALGVLWGFLMGSLVDWARERGRLVTSALRGEPVGQDGLRRLMDRPR